MKKILTVIFLFASMAGFSQRVKYERGEMVIQGKVRADSLYSLDRNGDTVNHQQPTELGMGLAFVDGKLLIDTSDSEFKSALQVFVELYGTGGGGGGGIQPSDTAAMLAGYTRVARFLDSISTLRTLANTKISNANLNVGYSGTQVTIISDNGTDAQIDGPTSSNSGVFTAALYNYFFTIGSATWGTGNVSVSALNQKHNITISSSGGRTLAFSFLDAGEVIAMHIDNTSGGTITLTLPSNSYVQNPTTGEYTSAASVTVITGKSSLYLSKYDGTNYWFVY